MRNKLEARIHEIMEAIDDSPSRITDVVDQIMAAIEADSDEGKVLEFHKTFEQVINETPIFPPQELIMARLSFELEEMTEFVKACGHLVYGAWQRLLFKESQEVHYDAEKNREKLVPNLKEAFDGWLDSKYFVAGRGWVMGFCNIGPDGFADVHDSNMSKACRTYGEAVETQNKYKTEGVETEIKTKTIGPDTKYLILRKSDKKVLKSINYHPVKLDKYIPDGAKDNSELNSSQGTQSGSTT